MSARHLAVLAMAGALSACSPQRQGDTPIAAKSQSANGTVAAMVAASTTHRELAAALNDTQLAPVLDGKGVYTLLAPNDTAFAELGVKADALSDDEHRALMVAVLRAHILPGEVTPEAIGRAIARKGGAVEMRTMAGQNVRFAKIDGGISVSNGSATAKVAGTPQIGSNGAILPIDGVLLPAQ